MLQHQYGSLEGPEPKQVDIPQRRSSLASRSGGSGSIITAAIAALPDSDDSLSPPRFRRELSKQESEAALLASVGGLSAVSRVLVMINLLYDLSSYSQVSTRRVWVSVTGAVTLKTLFVVIFVRVVTLT